MGLDLDHHIEIAVRSVVLSRLTLSPDRNHGIVIHSCRDVDLDLHPALHLSGAVTVAARCVNHGARSITIRTRRLGLHLAQHGLPHLGDDTGTAAPGTGALVGSRRRPFSGAGLALHILVQLDGLLRSEGRLLELDLDARLQVSALLRLIPALCTAAEPAESAESAAAEDITEDVSEVTETAESAAGAAAESRIRIHSRESESVILILLLRV